MKSINTTLRFTELLLTLLRGKTSLADGLRVLAGEGIDRQVRGGALQLLAAMKKGESFSEALRGMRESEVYFEPLYRALIAAAELTGNVEDVLERIALDLRRKQRAKENAINILIYPVLIVLIAVAGTIAIIVKGMPLFISGGLVSAAVVTGAKTGISVAGMVLLAGGAALFTVYFRIFYNDSPEFRIFSLLDFLLRSSVPVPEALSHCVTAMARTKYGKALVSIKKDIASGIPFSAAFAKVPYFPPYVTAWLSVAGVNGNAGEICGNIKNYYERKDDEIRGIASKLIEPSVIVLTGIYVLIIMLTVILPILTYTGGVI